VPIAARLAAIPRFRAFPGASAGADPRAPRLRGLGFDVVHFELGDGVTGEVAYGHTGNFM